MSFRRKWITLIILVVLLTALRYALTQVPGFIFNYNKYIFFPFQSVRCLIFDVMPFSVGDVLYVVAGAALLATLFRWAYFLRKFNSFKTKLAHSAFKMFNICLLGYLLFMVGWGVNYYKMSLKECWRLPYLTDYNTRSMTLFNQMLVDQINFYAPHYRSLSFVEINGRSKLYYKLYTDCKIAGHGLYIKPTLFSYFMERLGIDGYYNPFTGEGQVSTRVPAFIQPFVLCHEMAHQAGIAAEDDANLMAYALGTLPPDSTFRYSAYLNLWLYTKHRLYRMDSAAELRQEAELNKLTLLHIDTLEQIARKYHNDAAAVSTEIYDSYLKMQDQKEGIRSYGSVVYTAWLLEMQRKEGRESLIRIP